ncbi:hypothetical protein GON26_18945 [Flavobacterium sp. GA093]|uniref:Uncharacterized protein n=1 Tax=Flavobacterium hydrocarbonoxydans TaxID=2683249 RepID=A0A6I4NPQ9_9FLAO|nr:hypothetical protein [Flavobacterium hydrocarbonoxydans]MWB96446.1 hypothetical protein [Flavobacterium hydrocarbonoxydans]
MKFSCLVLILFFVNASVYSQKNTIDEIEIEILKTKEPSSFSTQLLRGIKFDPAKYKYVMVKCKVKSLGTNRALISAFSLLDTVTKIRYRVGDYLGYGAIIGNPERNYFRKTKPDRKNYPYSLPSYNENETDQFDKFTFEGYSNFEIPVELGTKKNPDPTIVYFGQTAYENFKAELFFIIPLQLNISVFDLYYKDSKIGIAKLE